MALVEQALRRLDHRGDNPGLRHDPAHRADGALADPLGDLADLELELGRPGERVAALVHRRRACMGGLAPERDLMTLDPESAEHDPEGELHRLEHRALLDMKL